MLARSFAFAALLVCGEPLFADTLTIQATFKEAIVGASYSSILTATGGVPPYTWSLQSGALPDGLVLTPGGIVNGSPKSAGIFTFSVGVSDSTGSNSAAILKIAVAYNAISVLTVSLPPATAGISYYANLFAAGGFGNLSWSLVNGSLPAGLSLQPYGQISGTATTVGSYPITFQVSDAGGASVNTSLDLIVRATFTPPPSLYSARSSASYSAALAPGSLVVLFGDSLGPDSLIQATSFPLPFSLGGTSVTITSEGVTLDCPMVYTSSKQVAVILPSKTPVSSGTGLPLRFNVTYNYASTADYPYYYSNFTIAPIIPGLYSLDATGAGPGIFTALDGSVKGFTNTAHPGEIVTTWATGLGAIQGDDAQPPSVANIPDIEVYVGSQAARVIYAGRSPCCSGLDQISFELPEVRDSCFVPVMIRGGGIISNFVTLPVSASGGTCDDSGPALPTSLYSRAAKGESLRMAAFGVGPQGILDRGGFPQAEQVAAQLSAALHTPVSTKDAERLLQALEKKNTGAVRRALWKYRRQWSALDSATRNALSSGINLTANGVAASFFSLNSSASLMSVITSSGPTSGSCIITGSIPLHLSAYTRALDASSFLTLTGPAGRVKMTSPAKGRYAALLGGGSQGPSVPPGTYAITGSGGLDVGPFSVELTVGNPVRWTSLPAMVDRAQPLTLTWSAGPGHVVFGGSSGGRGTFVCAEDAAKGIFTIPAVFLSMLDPAKETTFFIGGHPLAHPVSISGLDYAVFADASSDSKVIPVK